MRFLFLLAAFSSACFAYIPEYSLIATHAAAQHGNGGFLIDQEVSFRNGSDVLTVKETWWIVNENSMRVTLEGRGPLKGLVDGTIVYQGSQKSFIDSGTVRTQRLGDEWLEPLFHFRSSKYFRSRLASLKVTTAEALKDRPALNTDGAPQYEAPSFLRLSRVGGSVAWAIGTSPTVGQAPTLWLEQDQFVVRKFHSGTTVLKADDYAKYDDGLWFPRQRSYTFGRFTVDVTTLQVRSIGKVKPDDIRFRATGLNASRDSLKLPDAEALKEFYSRFR